MFPVTSRKEIMYVEVAIPIPSDLTFTYAVPAESRADVAEGKRVLVPFGRRSLTGTIVGVHRSTDRKDTKEILRVLDRDPLFREADLRFFRWAKSCPAASTSRVGSGPSAAAMRRT